MDWTANIGIYLFVWSCCLLDISSQICDCLCSERPAFWIWQNNGKSYYLDHIFLLFLVNFFPVSSAFFGENTDGDIIFSLFFRKIWTKRRRNPFGLCVGCMASANRLLLLHYAGYGADGSGKPVCYLYFTGDFYGNILIMKTQNIWVPIIIHFLNNNMVVVFSGTYSADVLQNQQIHWGDIPVALVMNLLIYGWVIFLKPFKEKKA